MTSVRVHMAPGTAESILAAAAAAHPLEACGLLVGHGPRIDRVTVANNVAAEPWHRFEVDPAHLLAEQRRARGEGRALLGAWHSHPDGRLWPSAADRDGQVWPSFWLMIAAGGRLGLWAPDEGWAELAIAPAAAAG